MWPRGKSREEEGLEDLVEFVLAQIALCGPPGINSADFRRFIGDFYRERHTAAAYHANFDHKFYENVWDFIRADPDIRIVYAKEPRDLTLSEFETLELQETGTNGADYVEEQREASTVTPEAKASSTVLSTEQTACDEKLRSFLLGEDEFTLAGLDAHHLERLLELHTTPTAQDRNVALQSMDVNKSRNSQIAGLPITDPIQAESILHQPALLQRDVMILTPTASPKLRPFRSRFSQTPIENDPQTPQRERGPRKVPKGVKLNEPVFDPPSSTTSGPRMYASQNRVWLAIANHPIDLKKLPALEFVLLQIIASAGKDGILQPELTKVSGQDKRSVPKRTDELARKGYIEKKPVHTAKMRTSLCVHKNCIRSGQASKAPITAADVFKNGSIDLSGFVTLLHDALKESGVIAIPDLRKKLGVTERMWSQRAVRNSILRLEETGLIKRLRARKKGDDSKWLVCVRMLREPNEDDIKALRFRRKGTPAKPIEKVLEEDHEGDDILRDLDLDAYSDHEVDGGEDDALDEVTRIPPQWIPDKVITNQVFEVLDLAGPNGYDSTVLKERSVGPFWKRPAEALFCRLCDSWETSQPKHLQHLALVRDTAITDEKRYIHYLYRTYGKHQDAVNEGVTSWEAVSEHPLKKSDGEKQGGAKEFNGHGAVLDANGFEIPSANDFANEGNTSTILEAREILNSWLTPSNRKRKKVSTERKGEGREDPSTIGTPLLENEDRPPSPVHFRGYRKATTKKPSLLTTAQKAQLGLRTSGRIPDDVVKQIRDHRERTGDPQSIPEFVTRSETKKTSTSTVTKKKQLGQPLLTAKQRKELGLPEKGRLGKETENMIRAQRGLPLHKVGKEKRRKTRQTPLLTMDEREKMGLSRKGRLPQSLVDELRMKKGIPIESGTEETDDDRAVEQSEPAPEFNTSERTLVVTFKLPTAFLESFPVGATVPPTTQSTKRKARPSKKSWYTPKKAQVSASDLASVLNAKEGGQVQTPSEADATSTSSVRVVPAKRKARQPSNASGRKSKKARVKSPQSPGSGPSDRTLPPVPLPISSASAGNQNGTLQSLRCTPVSPLDSVGMEGSKEIDKSILSMVDTEDRISIDLAEVDTDMSGHATTSARLRKTDLKSPADNQASIGFGPADHNSTQGAILDHQEQVSFIEELPSIPQQVMQPFETVSTENIGSQSPRVGSAAETNDFLIKPSLPQWNAINGPAQQHREGYQSSYATVGPSPIPINSPSEGDSQGIVGGSHTSVPSAPVTEVLSINGNEQEANAASNTDKFGIQQLKKRRKVSDRGVVLGGGSVARNRVEIIEKIVNLCGGIYPGNGEIVQPFYTLWKEKFPNLMRPDRTTLTTAVTTMCKNGRLKKFHFSVPHKHGSGVSIKVILALPHISGSDKKVSELQRRMGLKHPDKFYPEEVRLLVEEWFTLNKAVLPEKDDTIDLSASGAIAEQQSTEEIPQAETQLDNRISASTKGRKKANRNTAKGAPRSLKVSQAEVEQLQPEQGRWAGRGARAKRSRTRLEPLSDGLHKKPSPPSSEDVPLASLRPTARLDLQSPLLAPLVAPSQSNVAIATSSSQEYRKDNEFVILKASDFEKPFRVKPNVAMTHPDIKFYPNTGTFSTEFAFKPSTRSSKSRRNKKQVRFQESTGLESTEAKQYGGHLRKDKSKSVPATEVVDGIEASGNDKATSGAVNRKDRQSANEVSYTIIDRLTGLTGNPNDRVYVQPLSRRGQASFRCTDTATNGKPRKPRTRNPKRVITTLDSLEEFKKVFFTLVIARSMSTEDGVINWSIVKSVYLDDKHFDLNKVKKLWEWLQSNMSSQLEMLTDTFQSTYLEAYANGEVASLEDPKTHDWASLVGWALRSCPYPHLPLPEDSVPILHGDCIMDESSYKPFNTVDWHRKNLTAISRRKRLRKVSLVAPLHASTHETPHTDDDALRARSLIRSNTATPESFYDRRNAHEKLSTINTSIIEKTVGGMVDQQVIRMRKIKRQLPGRNYNFTAKFALSWRHWFSKQDFMAAVDFKKRLDTTFANEDPEKRVFPIPFDASNALVMVILNLAGEGNVKIVPKLPSVNNDLTDPSPRLSVWGFCAGYYNNRKLERDRLFWDMELVPTGTYPFGNPLSPSPAPAALLASTEATQLPPWQPLPEPPLPGKDDPNAMLPVWSTMDGQTVTWPWWSRVLNLVLQTMMVQPGITASQIHKVLPSNTTEVFEIELVLQWLVSVNAAMQCSGTDTKNGMFRLKHNFWAAFGDKLLTEEEDEFDLHVQKKKAGNPRLQYNKDFAEMLKEHDAVDEDDLDDAGSSGSESQGQKKRKKGPVDPLIEEAIEQATKRPRRQYRAFNGIVDSDEELSYGSGSNTTSFRNRKRGAPDPFMEADMAQARKKLRQDQAFNGTVDPNEVQSDGSGSNTASAEKRKSITDVQNQDGVSETRGGRKRKKSVQDPQSHDTSQKMAKKPRRQIRKPKGGAKRGQQKMSLLEKTLGEDSGQETSTTTTTPNLQATISPTPPAEEDEASQTYPLAVNAAPESAFDDDVDAEGEVDDELL